MTACAKEVRSDPSSASPHALLLAAWHRGEAAAFDQLYALTAPRLASYCLLLTGHEGEAQDLFQEAWSRALAKIDGYREDLSFPAWLAAIARNLWLNRLQRARAGRKALALYTAPPRGRPPSPPDEAFIFSDLLSRLDPGDREAARVMGVPPSTLRDRLGKAHDRLAGLMGPD